MNTFTIHEHSNDPQYHDNAKDGMSMNERTFIAFVKSLIREYGTLKDQTISIALDDLPPHIQKEYLKQWCFLEGYLEYYQEIFTSSDTSIASHIEENRKDLNFWLQQYTDEIEEEFFFDYLANNNLHVEHHADNGESYLVRR